MHCNSIVRYGAINHLEEAIVSKERDVPYDAEPQRPTLLSGGVEVRLTYVLGNTLCYLPTRKELYQNISSSATLPIVVEPTGAQL